MVAPVVASTSSDNATDSTSHTLDYPSGITSGDLVYLHIVADGVPTFTVSDFVQQAQQSHSGSTNRHYLGYRVITGAEGATFGVGLSASEAISYICFRVTGHEAPGTQAPELDSTDSGGNVTELDCPSVSPAGGSKDYLALTFCGFDTGNRAITGFPYTNNQIDEGGGVTGTDVTSGASSDAVTSDTIDPGNFTIDATRPGIAWTVVIHPVGEGGGEIEAAIAESFNFSEIQSNIASLFGSLSESVLLSDSQVGNVSIQTVILESLSFSENQTAVNVIIAALQESLSLSESQIVTAALNSSQQEGLGFSDDQGGIATLLASTTESLTFSEQQATGGIIAAAIEESLQLSENQTLLLIINANILEALTFNENQSVQAALIAGLTEGLALDDQLSGQSTLLAAIIESLDLSEIQAAAIAGETTLIENRDLVVIKAFDTVVSIRWNGEKLIIVQ